MPRHIVYKIRQKKSKSSFLFFSTQKFYFTIEDAHNGEVMVTSEMLVKKQMIESSTRFAKDLIGAELYDLYGNKVVL